MDLYQGPKSISGLVVLQYTFVEWKMSEWMNPLGWLEHLQKLSSSLREKVKVTQSCLILCDPTDCSPPGSSVHGISQAGLLEWAAISYSRGSSPRRDATLGRSMMRRNLALRVKHSILSGCLCQGLWDSSQGSDQEVSGSYSCPNAQCPTLSLWGFVIKTGEDSPPEKAAEVDWSN